MVEVQGALAGAIQAALGLPHGMLAFQKIHSEQFDLHLPGGARCEVQAMEWVCSGLAVGMNETGHGVSAGIGRPGQGDGAVRDGSPQGQIMRVFHGRRFPAPLHGGEVFHLLAFLRFWNHRDGTAQGIEQARNIDGLGEIILGPGLHGMDRRLRLIPFRENQAGQMRQDAPCLA